MKRAALTAFVLLAQIGRAASPADDLLLREAPRIREERPAEAFVHLCRTLMVPCSLEQAGKAHGGTYFDPELNLENKNVSQVLDSIVKATPAFIWTKSGGILALQPGRIPDNDPLERRVGSFVVDRVQSEDAVNLLFKKAGFGRSIDVCDGHDCGPKRQICADISLSLRNVTLRRALDAIARADGKVLWYCAWDLQSGDVGQYGLLSYRGEKAIPTSLSRKRARGHRGTGSMH